MEDPYHSGFSFASELVQHYSRPNTDFYLEYDFVNRIWYLNIPDPKTWFIDYGYVSSLKEINVAPEKGWSVLGWFEIASGHAYIFWTWNNHFAAIRVSSLGAGWAIFDWAYQTDFQLKNVLFQIIEHW